MFHLSIKMPMKDSNQILKPYCPVLILVRCDNALRAMMIECPKRCRKIAQKFNWKKRERHLPIIVITTVAELLGRLGDGMTTQK